MFGAPGREMIPKSSVALLAQGPKATLGFLILVPRLHLGYSWRCLLALASSGPLQFCRSFVCRSAFAWYRTAGCRPRPPRYHGPPSQHRSRHRRTGRGIHRIRRTFRFRRDRGGSSVRIPCVRAAHHGPGIGSRSGGPFPYDAPSDLRRGHHGRLSVNLPHHLPV